MSPVVLQRSGIGPGDELRRAGVDIVHDVPGVGGNLMDHLELYVQQECKQPITLYGHMNLLGKARIGLRWLMRRNGLGATNHFESGAHIRSRAGIMYPDIQFHFLPLAISYDGKSLARGHGFQVHVGSKRSKSRGSVRLDASDLRNTLALHQPAIVKQAAKLFPDQIVLAVDVHEGLVVSDGWRQKSAFTPSAFLKAFDNDPFAAIIVTDIDADMGDAEDSIALITQLVGEARSLVFARGLSRTLDDLSRLKYVPFVSGALIGRALFDGSIDFEAALEVAKPEAESHAKFI